MATDSLLQELVLGTSAAQMATSKRRRRISFEAGRALEILGHAIEYLADEYADSTESFLAGDPKVEAIQLLMALNRRIYFECPVVPTCAERRRLFFKAGAGQKGRA